MVGGAVNDLLLCIVEQYSFGGVVETPAFFIYPLAQVHGLERRLSSTSPPLSGEDSSHDQMCNRGVLIDIHDLSAGERHR